MMAKLLHAQIDLFIRPVVPVELTGAERQKAVALLQMLLTEAVTKPPGQSPDASQKETGDE
jgi:hypothetical protein